MATALFICLNALVVSINRVPSVSSSSKTCLMVCMAASAPALWPAQTCRGPAADLISSFKKSAVVLPTMRLLNVPPFAVSLLKF